MSAPSQVRRSGWPVLVAAMATTVLVGGSLVARRAGVLPKWSDARAELAALDTEVARREKYASKEPELKREISNLDEQLRNLEYILPPSPEEARIRFLESLRGMGAWSAEVESLQWLEQGLGTDVAGTPRYLAGKGRVRIVPSGWGWMETIPHVLHDPQMVAIDCAEVQDLSDPAAPITFEVTLYAAAPERH